MSERINLLVTGGCGFIGSNFINYIFNKNTYNIINIDNLYYCANIDNVEKHIQCSPYYTFIRGNICSRDLIQHVLINYKINIIIHFAAQSHVDNSFENSIQYTNDNIVGTHNLLECSRLYNNLTKFIHISTDEVYGESMNDIDEMAKTEQSILCPTNPYAATKASAELIAQSYFHSFNMPIIITRGNNVYGPNQYPEKLIPKFINLLKNNQKVTIQGDGSNVRSFLHSNDAVTAFEIIINKGVIGEIYNIGCDEQMEYSILDVTKLLVKYIKNDDNIDNYIEYIPDRPFNDKRYYISNSKIKNLGWDIYTSFEKGLQDLL